MVGALDNVLCHDGVLTDKGKYFYYIIYFYVWRCGGWHVVLSIPNISICFIPGSRCTFYDNTVDYTTVFSILLARCINKYRLFAPPDYLGAWNRLLPSTINLNLYLHVIYSGFTISEQAAEKGAIHNRPPTKSADQFTTGECDTNFKIACLRIHIERW